MSIMLIAESSNGSFKKQVFEAATYAFQLSQMLELDLFAVCLEEVDDIAVLGRYGIPKAYSLTNSATHFDAQSYAKTLHDIAVQKGATIVLCSHTSNAQNYAPYLSVIWEADMASAIVGMPTNQEPLTLPKNVFSGKAKAQIQLSASKHVISLARNSIAIQENSTDIKIEQLSISIPTAYTSSQKVEQQKGITPLPEAELVVSGGRGFKGPENWNILLDLADSLGASTACSRPVADSDWRPHHEHVGQTGVTIRPNLYIAIGISGAIQHLGGVNNSKVIVVINNDPEAPFFKAADYGICADLFEVVPKLTAAVQKFRASQS